MKIRNGFVSNSSSSSFLLLTTAENYEKVKATLTKFQQAVAEKMKTDLKAFGRDMVSFETWQSHGSSWSEHFYIDDEELQEDAEANPEGEDTCDAWDSFLNAMEKSPKEEYFTKSIDTG